MGVCEELVNIVCVCVSELNLNNTDMELSFYFTTVLSAGVLFLLYVCSFSALTTVLLES